MVDRVTLAVELREICVKRVKRTIISKLSVQADAGSWLGIVGANGSGKTTLLRAVAGRLPIASGDCFIGGKEMAGDRSARAKIIGFAPPIEHLPNVLCVRELLELAGEVVEAQQRRNQELWGALDISALLDRTIAECSSGMRQRAAIALAFANPTSLVILDEPFNWLDPVAAFDTRVALETKVRNGTTLLTALHDLATLCSVCDDGVLMTNGTITLELGSDKLLAGSRDIQAFERDMIEALRT